MSTVLSTDSGEVHIIENHFDIVAMKVAFENAKQGALDIETSWLDENPWKNPPDLVSIAITPDGRRSYVLSPEWVPQVLPLLKYTPWIMHNGGFDRLALREWFGIETILKHDTMAMQYLLDSDNIATPKSLEACSERWLGLKGYKNVDYENIEDEPFEKVALMNGEDTLRTFNLVRPMGDELNADPALSRVYQWIVMPAINELIEITNNGIPLDGERLAEATAAKEAEVEQLLSDLRSATPLPGEERYPKGWPKPSWWRVRQHGQYEGDLFNPGSWQQVGHVLYELWGLPILEWNKDKVTGENTTPSTNADVLLRLETYEATGLQQEWLHKLRLYRKATKLLSYFEAWPRYIIEGKMHPRFRPLKTVTGRLASEKPNIQNVPRDKDIRSMFRAPEGFVWVKADYSQIELRLAALAAQEETMLRAYRQGDDIHRLTGTLVLGDDSDEARQVGKTLNFGLLYGAGPATLQRVARSDYDVFLSLDEARYYKDEFFRAYPGLKAWHQRCEVEIETTGISRSPLGRIRHLPKAKIPRSVTKDDSQLWKLKMAAIREGTNHRIQSYASDILLHSLIQAVPVAKRHGALLVASVHDEVDFLCPPDALPDFSAELRGVMEDMSWLRRFGIKLGVPVVADVEAGPSWGEVRSIT